MSTHRTVPVFFYGLFMDAALLRDKGAHPGVARLASVANRELRIGRRATLIPGTNRIYGMVIDLGFEDLDRLYAEPSLEAYRPEAVICQLEHGEQIAALCYVLPEPPTPDQRNEEYVRQLQEIGSRLRLPSEYLKTIR